MKKKLLICLSLILALSVALAGCKKDNQTPDATPTPSEQVSPSPDATPSATPEATPDTTPDGGGAPDSDSAAGILAEIMLAAGNKLTGDSKLPMSFEAEITKDNCTGVGLTSEQLEQYVAEAYSSSGALTTSAHELVIFKCKDAESAAEVKKLVAEGFDPGKWICVRPDKCAAVDSGEYVLLAVSSSAVADAVLEAFDGITGESMGEVNEFYTHAG